MTSTLPMSDSRIPTDTTLDSIPTLALATDCPRCAWRDFGATDLDRDLIRQPLIDAWRRRGYHVTLLCHHDCAADPESVDDPPAGIYIEVRGEAAEEVPWGADFAAAAGLTEEYRRGEQ